MFRILDLFQEYFWYFMAAALVLSLVWTVLSVQACMDDFGLSWVTCLNLLSIASGAGQTAP